MTSSIPSQDVSLYCFANISSGSNMAFVAILVSVLIWLLFAVYGVGWLGFVPAWHKRDIIYTQKWAHARSCRWKTSMQSFELNIFLFSQIFWLALCQTEWITVNEAIFGKRSRAAAFVDPVTAPLTPNQTIQTRDGHDIVEPSFDNVCMCCVCWVNIISFFQTKNRQAPFQHV